MGAPSTRTGAAAAKAVKRAAQVLQDGGLVAFPTETVYGLGADATNDRAVARIFEAKARPRFNPLIVHVTDRDAAARLVAWSDLAERLANRFWPGPLTLILRQLQNGCISKLVSAGGQTVALRVPSHPLASALLKAAGLPIAAPSANPAGKISPTMAAHVKSGLGDRVDMILDGGACSVGVESTVLDISGDRPHLLRPGGLMRAEIEAVIGYELTRAPSTNHGDELLRSPGQLESHYAPNRPVRLNATDVGNDEALLAFGPTPLEGARMTANLSERGDLTEAAANLFAMMHDLDRPEVSGIAIMPIPNVGLGEAILDRLKRASLN